MKICVILTVLLSLTSLVLMGTVEQTWWGMLAGISAMLPAIRVGVLYERLLMRRCTHD